MDEPETRQAARVPSGRTAAWLAAGVFTAALAGVVGTRISAAVTAPQGRCSLQAVSYPARYVRATPQAVESALLTSDILREQAVFRTVPGLGDSRSVSLESTAFPGHYLRHAAYVLTLSRPSGPTFVKNATFRVAEGLAGDGGKSFESTNFPGYYLRQGGFQLRLEKRDESSLFCRDATFRLVDPVSDYVRRPRQRMFWELGILGIAAAVLGIWTRRRMGKADRDPDQRRLTLPACYWAGLLVAVALVVFVYTVRIRAYWFGEIVDGHFASIMTHTVVAARNWYHEGMISLRMAFVNLPPTTELPTVASRGRYFPYPPGHLVPVHALALLLDREPDPALVEGWNLANHCLVSITIGGTILLLLGRYGMPRGLAFLVALYPVLFILLSPGPIYWFQNAFFTDQAVILPFSLVVLLEVVRDGPMRRRWLDPLQLGVIFWGSATDYLFAFVVVALILKRWLQGDLGPFSWRFVGRSAMLAMPFLLALSLFVLQLFCLGGLQAAASRGMLRTGYSAEGASYVRDALRFWYPYAQTQYGTSQILLLCLAMLVYGVMLLILAVFRLIGRPLPDRLNRLAGLVGLLLLPCFVQLYVLRNHSTIHDFSVLKLALPMSTVPLVLLPLLLLDWARLVGKPGDVGPQAQGLRSSLKTHWPWMVLTGVVLVVGMLYFVRVHPRFPAMFPPPEVTRGEIARFVRANTNYYDMVCSPDFQILDHPSELQCLSRKPVWPVKSPNELTLARQRAGRGTLSLLFTRPPAPEWKPFLQHATLVRGSGCELYRGI